MKPAWLKLTEQWQATGHFGLTIPFLLGALRQWPGQPLGSSTNALEQLCALLASVRDDAPDGIIMRLYTCDRLHELVLAPVGGPPPYCVPVPSAGLPTPALYVEAGILSESTNPFDALVSEMWRRFGDAIRTDRFSYRAGAFHPFNDADRTLIGAVFARSGEDDT